MPKFDIDGFDRDGKRTTKTVLGETQQDAVAKYKAAGLSPTAVRPLTTDPTPTVVEVHVHAPIAAPSASRWETQRLQRIVLGGALTIALLMGLFPPWQSAARQLGSIDSDYFGRVSGSMHGMGSYSVGYSFLFDPPGRASIDIGRLFIQWAVVGFTASIILLYLRTRKSTS